jgi:flavodoxin
MKILVVYDSKFGNTERIARSIAAGFGPSNHVTVEATTGTEEIDRTVDLMIVGGPTQAHGASPAMKEFLARLPDLPGTKVATFDTRYDKPRWLTGAASGVIAEGLQRHGARPVVPGESFFIEHSEGPLLPGEEDRAAAWGATLVGRA